MTELVVETRPDSLRGVLFARVEGQVRFIADATCERKPSLSAAVEELAAQIAGQTGLTAGQIQRDPIFVVTEAEEFAITSLRAVDRRQAIAQCCAEVARVRGEAVAYIEARDVDGKITIVHAGADGRTAIESRPTGAPMPADMSDERAALIDHCHRAWRATESSARLIIAAEPFATMPPGVAILTLADIVDLTDRRMEAVVDPEGLAAVAGALGDAALGSVAAHDLLSFGLALVIEGDGEPGRLAARGTITSASGGRVRFSIPWGSVHWLAPSSWRSGAMAIAGQGEATIDGEHIARIEAGAIGRGGILLDARGPLRSATAGTGRLASWLADVADV